MAEAPPAPWKRVGLLVPSSNTSIEREYPVCMPRSVSFHFARLTMTRLDDDGMREQLADMRRAAESVRDARVDAVMLCQTAASFWMGSAWDSEIRQDLAAWAGARALTAAGTVLDALAALGATRVGFAAPFPPEVGVAGLRYLAQNGVTVLSSAFGGELDNFSIARLPPSAIIELACRADHREAEALLLLGGNMACMSILDEVETRLGKPVVTTNTAGMWALLALLGLPDRIEGAGRLLRDRPARQAAAGRQ